ncbi:sigma-70 family RNA polymerase sigma factor [Saccharibacillus kuerlensis]|uniref:RNA polymerase sigma factor n=1 Tax=Saccharibacillus kuerlensis TaxID=459527 RepID=A0ABQ2L4B0_9BACL|nr:sigma-70 family RNA polymerase sigma factor [Saccharibacillus kuerlensis]GGO02520.1 RNA polymerase sigma factor [Saccharibacillus kuerlensis]
MERKEEQQDLIERTLAGSSAAYAELYNQTAGELYKIIRLLVGNAEDAQDVMQETYLQVHRNLHQFDRNRAFRPWLTGIALRQVKACRRKRWMQVRKVGRAAQYGRETQEADFSGQSAERLDRGEWIERIGRLPYKLRQIVVLRYLNDYAQEEIAEMLGIPTGTVKSRIHAALERLRKNEPMRLQQSKSEPAKERSLKTGG